MQQNEAELRTTSNVATVIGETAPFRLEGSGSLLPLKRQEGRNLSVLRAMPGSRGSNGKDVQRHCPELDQLVPVAFLSFQFRERSFPSAYLI
jgi:hypothetical protein